MSDISESLTQVENMVADEIKKSKTSLLIVLLVVVIFMAMNTHMIYDLNKNKYRKSSDYGNALVYTGLLMTLGYILLMFNNINLVRIGVLAIWVSVVFYIFLVPTSISYFNVYNKDKEGKKFLFLRPDGEVASAMNILFYILIPLSLSSSALIYTTMLSNTGKL